MITHPFLPDHASDQDDKRAATLAALHRACIVAVVRTPSLDSAQAAAEALIEGGLTMIEITLTVPGATALIGSLVAKYRSDERILIGAGTVLTEENAEAALAGGARFLVSPVAPPDLTERAHVWGAPIVLGGLTPTEIVTALGLRADMVKVFPVGPVGGLDYVRALLGPFPDLPLMVSGGTRLADLPTYRALGVQTVAFTHALTPPELVKERNWKAITELAQQAVALMKG